MEGSSWDFIASITCEENWLEIRSVHMHWLRRILGFCARLFLSAIFLVSGVGKLFHWSDTERDLSNALGEWQTALGGFDLAHEIFSFLMMWVPALLIIATFLELLGGLLLLLGVKERFAVSCLSLFLIPTTILFHEFWFVEGSVRQLEMSFFLRNLAILGGLFLVLLHGTQEQEEGDEYYSPLDFPE